MPHAIEITGIEEVNSGIQSSMDSGNAFGLVGRSVEIGHSHAPEAKGRDRRPVSAKRACRNGGLNGISAHEGQSTPRLTIVNYCHL